MTLDFADKKIAVLGAGKMGGILLEGLVRNGYTSRTLGGPSLAFPPGRQCPAGKLVESLNNKRGSYRARQAAASSKQRNRVCAHRSAGSDFDHKRKLLLTTAGPTWMIGYRSIPRPL